MDGVSHWKGQASIKKMNRIRMIICPWGPFSVICIAHSKGFVYFSQIRSLFSLNIILE